MKKQFLMSLVLLGLLIPGSPLPGMQVKDQIILKNGKIIEGFKVKEDANSVYIQKNGAQMAIPRSMIEKIVESGSSSQLEKDGDVKYLQGRLYEAIEIYKQARDSVDSEEEAQRLSDKIARVEDEIKQSFQQRLQDTRERARQLVEQDQFDQAIQLLKGDIMNDPAMTEQAREQLRLDIGKYYCEKAREMLDRINETAAIEAVKTSLKEIPEYYESYKMMGDLLVQQADVTTAPAQMYAKALSLGDDVFTREEKIRLHEQAGRIFKQRGHPEKAINHFLKIIELGVDDQYIINLASETFETMAENYNERDEKSIKKTIADLNAAIELNPKRFEARQILSDVYLRLGQYEKALEVLQEMQEIDPNAKGTHLRMGKAYFGLNQLEKAEEEFQKEIEIDSNNYQAYLRLAEIYVKWKKYNEAVDNCLKTLNLAQDYFEAIEIIADAYYHNQQYDYARIWYNKILQVKPEDMEAKLKLAQIDLDQKKYDSAQKQLDQILAQIRGKYYPNDEGWQDRVTRSDKRTYAQCLTIEGTIEREDDNSPRSALTSLKDAVEYLPGYAPAYNTMGLCYMDLEQYEQAEESLIKARELEPHNPVYWNSLGTLYDKLRQPEKAIRHYKEYILRGGRDWKTAQTRLTDLNVPPSEIPESQYQFQKIQELKDLESLNSKSANAS